MKRFVAIFLFCTCSISHLVAQHNISIEPGDTVYFDIDQWHGDLQWQVSPDSETWSDLPGRTSDTIKYVPENFPSYFRAQITDGDCSPHYTSVVEVTEVPPVFPVVSTLVPQNISVHTCSVGGNVTEGTSITARGVVYSTTPNPDLDDPHTIDGKGRGSFSSQLRGLALNTIYYVRAYATNSLGTAYGEQFSFITRGADGYTIGSEGPAGGIIFYDKGSVSDGWRFLEAAPAKWNNGPDPWVDVEWGCHGTVVGGTSTDIGTGMENTALILAKDCGGNNGPARIADEAVINGFSDWFLPSRDELSKMYNNLFAIGSNFHYTFGFSALTYTSSSEQDATGAWGYDFAGSGNISHTKTDLVTIAVRPVRRF